MRLHRFFLLNDDKTTQFLLIRLNFVIINYLSILYTFF